MSMLPGPASGQHTDERKPRSPQRDQLIRDRYLTGETLASIGAAFGISAERVRKIVKKFGLDKRNAGLAIRNVGRSQAQQRVPYSVRVYGCSEQELRAIPDEQRLAFLQQRTNARRAAGMSWELSLTQWAGLWKASGKWAQRGQGPFKYGLCRVDPAGPYAISNVRVARNHEAAMRGRDLKSAARRRQSLRQARHEKWIREMARILKKSVATDARQAEPVDRQ
ncbi:MAG TPA: sigma factor-like helix-turn-helix DNA-binding protein [Burkholderiales bacterium]|nr:sigma factor-like helix-turn-helix DNA-binding protein [Burkholderiales bacterium]